MASQFMRWLQQAPAIEPEIFEVYRVTKAFYREAEYREDLEQTYLWYQETAKRHRRELDSMRGDVNLFRFFRR